MGYKMIGEPLLVISTSLLVYCSIFEVQRSAGYILFHIVLVLFACIPSLRWTVGIEQWFQFRPATGAGVEIGSLLVPMVLTSQMAFAENWENRNIEVQEVDRSYLLATQLMSMLTVSVMLITNHEKLLISSFFFFVVTTCIAATINIQWDIDFMVVSVCLCIYLISLFATLRYLPRCFTVGEAMIFIQSVVLLAVDSIINLAIRLSYIWPSLHDITGNYSNLVRGVHTLWIQIFVIGSLTTGVFLLPVFYYLSIVKNKWDLLFGFLAFYAVLVFSFFGFLLPWAVLMLGGLNPFTWLWEYLMNVNIRVNLVLYWSCVVFIAVCFVAWKSTHSGFAFSKTVVRKCFHVLALGIYIPGVVYEPYITHLASSVAVASFVFVEYVRMSKIGPFGASVDTALRVFLDDKDSGSLILTHVYLLLGFAVPLWLFPVDYNIPDYTGCKLALYSGILTLGVGDTVASVVGRKIGRCRFPGSLKTLEGTTAGIISQLLVVRLLQYNGIILLPGERWLAVSAAVTAGSLLEALTSQIDNIILSPFLYSLLLHKCR